MTTKELLKGVEVDVNRLIDTFAAEVQNGKPLSFGTFKTVWKSLHMAFLLVCAPSEDEVGAHIQDIFMCAMDRFDVPSPLKFGQHFGELHKPRLRRSGAQERLPSIPEVLSDGQRTAAASETEPQRFCDPFKDAPDFPKAHLQQFISFEARVAVFYTLYCVYKEQCLEPRVCIHVPIDLLPLWVEFLPEMMEKGVMDGVYIFQQLWNENAFVFDVLRRPPSFLSLPLETSSSEAAALRELSFHLKTSLQVSPMST